MVSPLSTALGSACALGSRFVAFPHHLLRHGTGIAFNMRPLDRTWGGGNWWLTQMISHLQREGYDVRFDLKREPDCIIVVDPRVGGNVVFGHEEISRHKARHPAARCLHRINEGDMHRGTPMMDELLADVNRVADHTIFISEWVRDYHAERWFDRSRPHSVILNGADPAIFNPVGGEELEPGGAMRLVTHHWSDNPRKGYDVYQEIDRLIDDGDLEQFELWVIGRWPESCEWRTARTIPPTSGQDLSGLHGATSLVCAHGLQVWRLLSAQRRSRRRAGPDRQRSASSSLLEAAFKSASSRGQSQSSARSASGSACPA